MTDAQPATVMPTSSVRNRQFVLAGDINGGDDVGGVHAADDQHRMRYRPLEFMGRARSHTAAVGTRRRNNADLLVW